MLEEIQTIVMVQPPLEDVKIGGRDEVRGDDRNGHDYDHNPVWRSGRVSTSDTARRAAGDPDAGGGKGGKPDIR